MYRCTAQIPARMAKSGFAKVHLNIIWYLHLEFWQMIRNEIVQVSVSRTFLFLILFVILREYVDQAVNQLLKESAQKRVQ